MAACSADALFILKAVHPASPGAEFAGLKQSMSVMYALLQHTVVKEF
jgi:hypothetical protein